jgi:hypothetical protein
MIYDGKYPLPVKELAGLYPIFDKVGKPKIF